MGMFYGYMTESERASAIDAMNFESRIIKLNAMYESVDKMLGIAYNDAEIKVLMEHGSADDLEDYYREANEEAGEKKKGILLRMIEAIQEIINNLVNKMRQKRGLTAKLPNNATIKDTNPDDKKVNVVYVAFNNLMGKVKSALSTPNDDNIDEISWKKCLVAAAGAVGAALLTKGAIEKIHEKIDKGLGDADKTIKEINQKVSSATPDSEHYNLWQRCLAELSAAINAVKSAANWIETQITGLIKHIFNNGTDDFTDDDNSTTKKTVKRGPALSNKKGDATLGLPYHPKTMPPVSANNSKISKLAQQNLYNESKNNFFNLDDYANDYDLFNEASDDDKVDIINLLS